MNNIALHSTRCAICNTQGNAIELYAEHFGLQDFNPAVFSARRLPDHIHYRIVKCIKCGLVRSDTIIDSNKLFQLYVRSNFNYARELSSLRLTYGVYLKKLVRYGVKKGSLLEIGCGNGFFLKEALSQGYATVKGVEPSVKAVAKADPDVSRNIICDIMRPGLFEPNQFDVICIFQVLEHIADPGVLLDECFRILNPGGFILCLNHNVEALSAKLLKAHSPIIDIEHTYLYSPSTINQIFRKHGFYVRDIGSVANRYTLYSIVKLIPLPNLLKRVALKLLKNSFAGRLQISVRLGNLYLIAQKPAELVSKISVFDDDILKNKGYLYTANARLSSISSNRRLTDAALAIADFSGKRVLDVGCGDGTYTLELFDRGMPYSIHGIDPAEEAIRAAQEKTANRRITFEVQSAARLPYESKSFDIGHLRGVLHHLDNPFEGLREAWRVSRSLVVIEPNGYNPFLKILEKISLYHIRHKEKSYTSATLEQWVKLIGGKIYKRSYIGLVPFFCPDWMAKILKSMESIIERLPFINSCVCACYIVLVVGLDD